MNKIKQFIKNTYKIVIIYIMLFLVLIIPLPYYIYTPGGLININDRVKIDKEYKSKGSLNLSYVSEYDGKVLTYLIGLINKNWDIVKKQKNISTKDYDYLDRLKMEEAFNNATIVAYQKAHKKVSIKDTKVYVEYIFKESKTDLQIGDQITHINNVKVNNSKELNKVINNLNEKDNINIKVLRNNQKLTRKATIINYHNKPIIGIGIFELNDIETKPSIKYSYSNNEYGPSGGLMLALSIYNRLTKKDITKGKTIVGTGTIDIDGNIGAIDGVKYKIKGAAKKKIDLFIVPKANLKEALKVKKKNNYHMEIVGVETFDEALTYLKNDLDK